MTSAVDDPRPIATLRRRVPGDPGFWVFIAGDLLVFGAFFTAHAVSAASSRPLYEASRRLLDPTFGLVNTLLLVTSSLLVAAAVVVRRGTAAVGATRNLLLGGIACGLVFSALKVVEYTGDARAGLRPNTDAFFTWYYFLTGLHWFHLLVGLAVLAAMTRMVNGPRDQRALALFESGACYWHLVDLLWIVIFPLLYLV